jgi:hypothetical protein
VRVPARALGGHPRPEGHQPSSILEVERWRVVVPGRVGGGAARRSLVEPSAPLRSLSGTIRRACGRGEPDAGKRDATG